MQKLNKILNVSYFTEIRIWGLLALSHALFVQPLHTHKHPPPLACACTHANLSSVYYLCTVFSARKNVFSNWKHISQFPQQTELLLTPGGLCQSSVSMGGSPDQLMKKHPNMKSLLLCLGSVLPLDNQGCVCF